MSSRLKRKLGDLGVDTSSSRANESFCLIGTPLPPLEKSKDTGEFVPLWKQDVRDEKGRRRLHGAFTGGFSAGYFNSVGSKEGWAPSTFVSSRGDRAKQKTARPEDFMDDEDLQELKDSRNLIDTTDEMDLTGGSRGGLEEPETDSITTALEASMLPPPSDSSGARILKKMGWRLGQGIGPRVTLRQRKQQDLQLSFGGRITSDVTNIPDDDEEASKHTYAPRDTRILLVDRKENSHGLGYDPGMGLNESLGVKGGAGGSIGPRLASGFGLGALNDADEDDLDVYDGGLNANRRREAYDNLEREDEDTILIGGRSERVAKQPVRPASSVSFFRDGQPVLPGFALSDKPVAEDRWFPLSDIPKGWIPDPKRVWAKDPNKENAQPKGTGSSWDTKISADQRGSLLGETPLPSAPRSVFDFMSQKDRERLQNISSRVSDPTPTSAEPSSSTLPPPPPPPDTIQIPCTEPQIAQAALRGFQPFANDPSKHARYHLYLQSQLFSSPPAPALPLLPGQRIADFNSEASGYAQAAKLFRPVSGAMAGRFTSAAVVDTGKPVHAGLHTPTAADFAAKEEEQAVQAEERAGPKAHAARMGMYGPLTREVKPWTPAKLLCKRFGVKEPEIDVPTGTGTGTEAGLGVNVPMEVPEEATAVPGGLSFGSSARRAGPKDIANVGLGEDDDQGRDTLTYERPAMSVFKAIFASDDEESDEEKDEPEPEPEPEVVSLPKPLLVVTPRVDDAPATAITATIGIGTFKPTFIPRDKKSTEKDAKKEKKEKRRKEKRAVLSFEIDEEGGGAEEAPRPRPKKKKRREDTQHLEGDEDGGMWVEKPVPAAVLQPVPPSSVGGTSPNGEGEVSGADGQPAGRGRKRAIDFM